MQPGWVHFFRVVSDMSSCALRVRSLWCCLLSALHRVGTNVVAKEFEETEYHITQTALACANDARPFILSQFGVYRLLNTASTLLTWFSLSY